MLRRISEFVFGLIAILWGHFFAGENLKPELYGIGIGLMIALLIDVIVFAHSERHFLKIYFDCFKPSTNKKLRLSFAYLFRIEMNGKYLLVKSNRIKGAYQPVGGVYKYFHLEAKDIMRKINAIPDTKICNDEVSEYDLRLILSNRTKVRHFIKWFLSNKQRELDPWREFHEELILEKILPSEIFGFIFSEQVGQYVEPIHFDGHFKIDTLKYVDVYTPRYVNQKQKDAVKNLLHKNSKKYIWVTKEEIENKISGEGKRIADHTFKIFCNDKK